MAATKILGVLFVLAIAISGVSVGFAQQGDTHFFDGTVTMDGEPVENGTEIVVLVNGALATTVRAVGGEYFVAVDDVNKSFDGGAVNFLIGGFRAFEEAIWRGPGSSGLNLSARTDSTGPQGPQGPEGADGAAGEAGPVGRAGAPGADGATGLSGAIGPSGAAGSTGSQGFNGEDGSDAIGIVSLILALIALVAGGGALMFSRKTG